MNELERHTEKGGLLPLEYVRIAPGWWRCDCPTIMDGLVVRYYRAKEPWNHHKPDQVSASRNGVCVNVDATSGPELVELIAIVRVAQRQHLRIGELGRGDPCSPHQDAEIFVKEIRS